MMRCCRQKLACPGKNMFIIQRHHVGEPLDIGLHIRFPAPTISISIAERKQHCRQKCQQNQQH